MARKAKLLQVEANASIRLAPVENQLEVCFEIEPDVDLRIHGKTDLFSFLSKAQSSAADKGGICGKGDEERLPGQVHRQIECIAGAGKKVCPILQQVARETLGTGQLVSLLPVVGIELGLIQILEDYSTRSKNGNRRILRGTAENTRQAEVETGNVGLQELGI